MWRELEPPQRVLPAGIITVDDRGKVRFGAKDVRQWGLHRYNAVKVSQDTVTPSLIAFQLCVNKVSKSIKLRHTESSADFSAAWLAAAVGIKAGRYMAKKDKDLIIVDFSYPLTDEQVDDMHRSG